MSSFPPYLGDLEPMKLGSIELDAASFRDAVGAPQENLTSDNDADDAEEARWYREHYPPRK